MSIPIDRVAADRPFYSGKHKEHGVNLQVIVSPDGAIVWVSGALPGSLHDLKAARIWGAWSANWPPPGSRCRPTRATSELARTSRRTTRARTSPSPLKHANRSHAKHRGPDGEPTPN